MSIAGLTRPPLTGGIYRIVGPYEGVVRELTAAGWRVATAAESASTTAFYAAVASALDLPAWFGANLDALWDSLTDLSEPTALVLRRWPTFVRARPERWQRIEALLQERAEQPPPFAVVLL